ncbi:MAG: MarR family winged helix-turn-helix transcriptional regulator [Acidobacteriota bacterium]|jgi:DNA-binding MarR family transcriptional regulator
MSRRAEGAAAFGELVDETRALFHRLRHAAEQLHGGDELTAGRRGVLQSLRRDGPQTMPEMARRRPVSRQYIQTLVNDLRAGGYVEMVDNPAHKRSKLVRLTAAGKALIETMEERERGAINALQLDLSATRLRDASEVLRLVRAALEEAPWEQIVEELS